MAYSTSDYPEPTASSCKALEERGGWSKWFKRTQESIDNEIIIGAEGQDGFWDLWVEAKRDEQLQEEVRSCVKELRKGGDKRDKAVLERLMKKALLLAGWKPNEKPILAEMRQLKKEKKEILSWLKSKRRK